MEISSNDQNQKNMNEIKTEKEENNSILNEDEENEIEEDRQSTLKEGDEQTQNIEEIQKINFPENTNDYQNMKISNNFNNNYITFGDINNLNNLTEKHKDNCLKNEKIPFENRFVINNINNKNNNSYRNIINDNFINYNYFMGNSYNNLNKFVFCP